ncbi:hypothetical protein F52700_5208 [Fusarium sp. NRRL 52700]|nr:hypothetical protein F52700_5208 [Fusarium sp. NRRL 52700]
MSTTIWNEAKAAYNYSHNLAKDPDTYASTSTSPVRKGERDDSVQAQGLSPPPLVSMLSIYTYDPETPTRKRQRLYAQADLELIPRPQYEPSNEPVRAPSSRASSIASGRTRSTSPLMRQFLELRLDERGLETKALNVDALEALPNPEAASLLRTMRRIGNCKGIIPQDLRDQVLKDHGIKREDLDDWDSAFKDSDAFAHLPGRIRSAREIELTCSWTTGCINSMHEEAGWNDEIHFRLLQAAFGNPGEKIGGLFNITTRQAAHSFAFPTGFRMVDFCLYADSTQQNIETAKSYEDFCRTTPTRSVNHTDFQRLQMHPIVLSIETKAGSNSDAAELQIGVWHAAQWAFLKSSILRAQDGACSIEQQTKQADEALSRLRFIPAVIVLGHRWLFVLSTRQGQKTILWKEYQFGSTSTVVETYQIVAGLRQLAAWAYQVYLP